MYEYLDLEISLSGSWPLAWRRFLVPTSATFLDLHEAIQALAGWESRHLYRFVATDSRGRVIAGTDEVPGPDGRSAPRAAAVPLSSVFFEPAPKACRYAYDFGDDWQVDVVFRGVGLSEEAMERMILGGACAFPPEDSGGMPMYERMAWVRRQGEDPWEDPEELEELEAWWGAWDPDDFDLDEVSSYFDRRARPQPPTTTQARQLRVSLAATAWPEAGVWRPSCLPCWKRPDRKPCRGLVEVRRVEVPPIAEYRCPSCGNEGFYDVTMGDLSRYARPPARHEHGLDIGIDALGLLLLMPELDPEPAAALARATPSAKGQAQIRLSPSELASLVHALPEELRSLKAGSQRRLLRGVHEQLAAHMASLPQRG